MCDGKGGGEFVNERLRAKILILLMQRKVPPKNVKNVHESNSQDYSLFGEHKG